MLRYSQRRIARHSSPADRKIYTFVSFRTCLQHTGPNIQRCTRLWPSISRSTGRRHPISSIVSSNSSSNHFRNHRKVMSARIVARSTSRGTLYGDTSNTNAAKILDSNARIVVTGRSNGPTCPRTLSISMWASRFTWSISRPGIELLNRFFFNAWNCVLSRNYIV